MHLLISKGIGLLPLIFISLLALGENTWPTNIVHQNYECSNQIRFSFEFYLLSCGTRSHTHRHIFSSGSPVTHTFKSLESAGAAQSAATAAATEAAKTTCVQYTHSYVYQCIAISVPPSCTWPIVPSLALMT